MPMIAMTAVLGSIGWKTPSSNPGRNQPSRQFGQALDAFARGRMHVVVGGEKQEQVGVAGGEVGGLPGDYSQPLAVIRGAGAARIDALDQHSQSTQHQLLVQVFLGGEVVVEGAEAEAGFGGDVRNRRAVDALLRQQALGGGEEVGPDLRRALFPAAAAED